MSTVTTNEPKVTEASADLQAKRAAFIGAILELAAQGQMLLPYALDACTEGHPSQAALKYNTHAAVRQAAAALNLPMKPDHIYDNASVLVRAWGRFQGLDVYVQCIADPLLHRPAGWEHVGTRMRRLCSCGTPTGWHESKAPAVEQLAGHIARSSAPAVA